jgi:4-amino-4-deoxy-L-arabinose transferase-like glycosyltransferase
MSPRLRYAFAAVLAIALLARVVVIVATPHFVPATDAADYDRIAVSLADTGGFPSSEYFTLANGPTAYRPPAFPLLLAGAYKLSGTHDAQDRWRAGRILEALLGTAAVVLIALIALALWNPAVALTAAAIAAVYPPFLLIGSTLLSESLFVPLVLAVVLCALRFRSSGGRLRWAALAGVLLGLTTLTRGNGIVLLAPVGFLVWTGAPRFSRETLRAPLTLLAAALITLVPWTIRNQHVLHAFVPLTTESGYALAGTYSPAAQNSSANPAFWLPPRAAVARVLQRAPHDNEAQISSALNTVAFDYVKAHPVSLLKTAGWSTLRLFNLVGPGFESRLARYESFPRGLTDASVYAFWVLALLAIGGAFTRAARGRPRSFWWCPAALLLSTVLLFGTTRYRVPADPFFVMLAALGVLAAYRRLAPSVR